MRVMSLSLPGVGQGPVTKWIADQHRRYLNYARIFAFLYYASRTIAGVGSALLPFVVANHPRMATAIAIAVAVTVAVDSIFQPREYWQLYSQATDVLAVAQLRLTGDYDKYKELIDAIQATEKMKLERLKDLKEILDKITPPKPE
jgi:hypothetical protein